MFYSKTYLTTTKMCINPIRIRRGGGFQPPTPPTVTQKIFGHPLTELLGHPVQK